MNLIDDEEPDPEVGIWGWEEGKNINLPLRELSPLEKLQVRQRVEDERRWNDYRRRQKEMERQSSLDFNRYLIQTYNEARKNEK